MRAAALEIIGVARSEDPAFTIHGHLESAAEDDAAFLAIGVLGDGDYLMGVSALWTASHFEIPVMIVVADNRSYFNDEMHQERVARMRNRPVENRWVGQRISEPDIDLAGMARAQGAQGFGPVTTVTNLGPTFDKAIAAVEAGALAVVHPAHTQQEGALTHAQRPPGGHGVAGAPWRRLLGDADGRPVRVVVSKRSRAGACSKHHRRDDHGALCRNRRVIGMLERVCC